MNTKTAITIILIFSGIGLLGLGAYWIVNQINNQNAYTQAEIASIKQNIPSGSSGGSIADSLLKLVGL